MAAAIVACGLSCLPPTLRAEEGNAGKAESSIWKTIVCYPNSPAGWSAEELILVLLKENRIQCVACGSAGASLNVPGKEEIRARRLVAELVVREKLPVTLGRDDPDAGRWIIMKPEEVLAEK